MPCGLFYATTFISQHLDKSCMILFECASCPPDYKNLMMTPWEGVSSGWSCGPVVLWSWYLTHFCQSSGLVQENYSDPASKQRSEKSESRTNAQESGEAVSGRGKGKVSLIFPPPPSHSRLLWRVALAWLLATNTKKRASLQAKLRWERKVSWWG